MINSNISDIKLYEPSFDHEATGFNFRDTVDGIMSFLLIATLIWGLVQIIWDGNIYVYWLSILLLTACGVIGLLRCSFDYASITIWDVFAASMALGYGVGTLNSELSYINDYFDLLDVTFASRQEIAEVTGMLLLIYSFIALCGRIDKEKLFPKTKIVYQKNVATEIVVLSVLITIAAIGATAIGAIGFHGNLSSVDGGVQVSISATLLVAIIPAIIGLIGYVLPLSTKKARYILLVCVLILLAIQIYQGRRVFLYSLVMLGMTYFIHQKINTLFDKKKIIILICLVLAASGASKIVIAARMASTEMHVMMGTTKFSFNDLVDRTVDILLHADRMDLDKATSENQQFRTYVIGYLAELFGKVEKHGPVHGEVAKFAAAIIVPFMLWPEKIKYSLLGDEENVYHAAVGLPSWDAANSIFTAGIADFGTIGFFLYPIILILFYRIFIKWSSTKGEYMHIFVSSIVMYQLWNIESTLGVYFVVLRNLVIIIVLMRIYLKFSAWFSRYEERRF